MNSIILAAGDLSGPITDGLGDLKPEVLVVAGAGIAVGMTLFGIRRLFGFGKSLAK